MLDEFNNSSPEFPKLEHDVLAFWDKGKIFERSISERKLSKKFVFYDGPPFATGLPHYGNFIPSILKDIIPRYQTMNNRRVERRFGWDCHGLPVEYEIDKTLGLEGRKAIEQYGIAKYNDACRSIVLRYTAEWEKTIHRIGRWVDFKNCYKTMDLSFMESVWWVFKQLWDQGLIYEGYKVMPYSTACATPLSNFESNLNYKDVQDPSLTLLFKKKSASLDTVVTTPLGDTVVTTPFSTYFLVWTTTPWTLPSNLALSVHPEEEYVEILDLESTNHFILAAPRMEMYFKDPKKYKVVKKFLGKELEGQKYEPLFPYFQTHPDAFRVLLADFVTMEDGTGIVHTAPGFGEDDYRVCQKEGIKAVCPVDDDGKFTDEISDYTGLYVKDADKPIIQRLKHEQKLFSQETIQHSYPFCWRSETPLIYRAVNTWFVKVESIKDKIIESNQSTQWVPSHLKQGRFGKWLEGAKDWAISRNRYWGCPIPIWRNEESGKIICMGSAQELEELSGVKIKDLHRQYMDDISFSKAGEPGQYRRISEVLDCWFESGAMPYAQAHYPFENKEEFEKNFPADFIAEGLDQTRGWFYTLMVLGTALFKKSPVKNIVVNGLILAQDGKKMSKRLKNYPDPTELLEKYGADALRLYLIDSPLVRAEELRFVEDGVKDIVRRVLLKWWNSHSFYMNYALIEKFKPQKIAFESQHVLDRWILSRFQTLVRKTTEEMNAYRLYTVVPQLIIFIEELTNTYIRLNRKRFWAEEESKDKIYAFETLFEILLGFSKMMAPFTPFLSERVYQQLQKELPQQLLQQYPPQQLQKDFSQKKDSVHLEDYPKENVKLIHLDLEDTVERMQSVILMSRNLREKMGVKVKIPLKTMTISHRSQNVLMNFKVLEHHLKEELNIRAIQYDTREFEYVNLQAKPNLKVLGPRLGKKMASVVKQIEKLNVSQVLSIEEGKEIVLDGERLTHADILIMRVQQPGHEYTLSNPTITISLDPTIDEDQILEGHAREVVNRIQKMRKTANFSLDDRIDVQYICDETLKRAIESKKEYVSNQVLAKQFIASSTLNGDLVEEHDIDGDKIKIAIRRLKK